MVTIIDYRLSKNESGEEFYSLVLQGGIELIRSEATGNMYATARKTRITSTFNEATCQSLIGTKLPGKIEKVACNPYEYQVPDSDEVIELSHNYSYVPEEQESAEEAVLS